MKFIKHICFLIVFIFLGYLIYDFFFNCERNITFFDQNFTLSIKDYAKVDDEAYVKLLKVNDYRCKEENCDREGQIEYKLIVLNDMRVRFVTLSTLETPSVKIEKTDYILKLIEGIDETKATFALVKDEEKK